jgi:hypothetical protein
MDLTILRRRLRSRWPRRRPARPPTANTCVNQVKNPKTYPQLLSFFFFGFFYFYFGSVFFLVTMRGNSLLGAILAAAGPTNQPNPPRLSSPSDLFAYLLFLLPRPSSNI